MSAFRDLLQVAHAKGVKRFAFCVDLDAFFADAEADSWQALDDAGRDGEGRTGEEALRRIVERL